VLILPGRSHWCLTWRVVCHTLSKVQFPNNVAYALASFTALLQFFSFGFCNGMRNKIKYNILNLDVPRIAQKITADAKRLIAFKHGSCFCEN
jgi:hypothetical protein